MPSEPGWIEFGRVAIGWNIALTLKSGGGVIRYSMETTTLPVFPIWAGPVLLSAPAPVPPTISPRAFF